jgi:hypothetical protein
MESLMPDNSHQNNKFEEFIKWLDRIVPFVKLYALLRPGHTEPAPFGCGCIALIASLIGIVAGVVTIVQFVRGNDSIAPEKHALVMPANVEWYNTGINLKAGQTILITASGKVNTWDGRPEGDTISPDGQDHNPPCSPHPELDNKDVCLINGELWGTLVGKIGQGEPFKIGTSVEVVVAQTGTLFLAVNDNSGYFQDNSGVYDVIVAVSETGR